MVLISSFIELHDRAVNIHKGQIKEHQWISGVKDEKNTNKTS